MSAWLLRRGSLLPVFPCISAVASVWKWQDTAQDCHMKTPAMHGTSPPSLIFSFCTVAKEMRSTLSCFRSLTLSLGIINIFPLSSFECSLSSLNVWPSQGVSAGEKAWHCLDYLNICKATNWYVCEFRGFVCLLFLSHMGCGIILQGTFFFFFSF